MQRLNTDGSWRAYSVADGLAGVHTEHIAEDVHGDLWVGTWTAGVCRFDGDRFQTFTMADGLPGDRVLHILPDRQGRMWFGTDAGMCWWDGQTFQRLAPGAGVPDKRISLIAEASDGRLYLAGNQVMGYCEEGRYHDLLPAYFAQFGAPSGSEWISQCWDLAEDHNGHIWYGRSVDWPLPGVIRYDGSRFTRFGEEHGLAASASAYALEVDATGAVWVGGNGQIWCYGEGSFEPVAEGFHANVRKIQCDREGRLWFCTNGDGVLCYDGDRFHHFTIAEGLPFEVVNAMHQDREGLFWFATYGGGLGCYDPHGIRVLAGKDGMPASTTVVEDVRGDIWMEYSHNLSAAKIARYDGEGVEVFVDVPGLSVCTTIYRDSADRLLFGGSGLLHHDGTTFHSLGNDGPLAGLIVTALGEDDRGALLLGYLRSEYSFRSMVESPLQIGRYDGTRLEPVLSLDTPWLGVIETIIAASQGGFWFGISALNLSSPEGCGLGRWHPDEGLTFYTMADGLVDDDITGLAEDGQGVLWITTYNGISRFDGTAFRTFSTADGLPTNRVHCVYLDRQEQLWFGTEAGVVRFNGAFFQTVSHPQISATYDIMQDHHGHYWFATLSGTARYRPASTPPRVRVHQVLADRPYPAGDPIQFSTSTRQVICEYTGMSFRTRPEHMLYCYRLSGHQEEWSPPTHERRAFFQDLIPGQYTFEVRAIDRDLNESAPATIAFRVVRSRRDERIGALEEQVAARTSELEDKNAALTAANERAEAQNLALAEARDRAESASLAKSAFLANISHEIRTPMNAILGYAQLLRHDDLQGRQRLDVESIQRAGTHLLQLINEVLDLSKIEAGQQHLRDAPFDLDELLGSLASIFSWRCEEEGLAWELSWAGGATAVLGDAAKLTQVLTNLLGNAVKFTDDGEVSLRVVVETGRRHRFEVRDTGIGISEDEKETLFQPFQQGEPGQERGGTGLGLAIAQRLVRLMGGELQQSSHRGAGSLFAFAVDLPAAAAAPVSHVPYGARYRLAESRSVRALVADDVEDNRRILQRLLEDMGIRVALAADGGQALGRLLDERFDIAFVDIRMPVLDGREVVRQLRRAAARPDLPIVAISASVFEHERASFRDAGFDDFLGKPFELSRLAECLQAQLRLDLVVSSARPDPETGETDDLAEVTVPEALRARLLESARWSRVTALEEGLQELEALGPAQRSLAARIRELLRHFDTEGITLMLREYRGDG